MLNLPESSLATARTLWVLAQATSLSSPSHLAVNPCVSEADVGDDRKRVGGLDRDVGRLHRLLGFPRVMARGLPGIPPLTISRDTPGPSIGPLGDDVREDLMPLDP